MSSHRRSASDIIPTNNASTYLDKIPIRRSFDSLRTDTFHSPTFKKHGGVNLNIIQSENLHTKGIRRPKYYVEVAYESESSVKYLERTRTLTKHNQSIDQQYFFPIENFRSEYVVVKVVERGVLIGSIKRKVRDIPRDNFKIERMNLPNTSSGHLLLQLNRRKLLTSQLP
ncbi:hypothetical protein AKO1_002615 [Acrasis kona]|uniref:4-hydroxy-3-methylbut-2-en-1-yl diphosphate synthase n=1 Tax=Acrasis kona TaxID=1008807 RepID=A0AAW2ZQH2_9EUKA